MARADILVELTHDNYTEGAGVNYLVITPGGVIYEVAIDPLADVAFRKSSDGGLTWSIYTIVFAGTTNGLAIWYDRWSGIAAGLIHCAYTEAGTHDTLYRTINTESSDTLSTQTVIFAGVSAVVAGSMLTIARARGGNVYCRTCIDAGAEGGFFRLPTANVPSGAWDAARTINETLATQDQGILLPGHAADNQDMMLIFWDASADEISRQLYDDSANSWAEASIATSMVDYIASGAAGFFANFAAAVDLANNKNLLVAWPDKDTANTDLRYWSITESAITEGTNVVLNSTDDQGMCAIGIDTDIANHRIVFYMGKSDGSETWKTALNIYYKVSTDDGATWGAETLLNTAGPRDMYSLLCVPRFATSFCVAYRGTAIQGAQGAGVYINVPVAAAGGGGSANLLAGKLG